MFVRDQSEATVSGHITTGAVINTLQIQCYIIVPQFVVRCCRRVAQLQRSLIAACRACHACTLCVSTSTLVTNCTMHICTFNMNTNRLSRRLTQQQPCTSASQQQQHRPQHAALLLQMLPLPSVLLQQLLMLLLLTVLLSLTSLTLLIQLSRRHWLMHTLLRTLPMKLHCQHKALLYHTVSTLCVRNHIHRL
jgi:hypothetical protein